MILVPDLIGSQDRLESLDLFAGAAHVDEDLTAGVQDEAVPFVHGRNVQWHLCPMKLYYKRQGRGIKRKCDLPVELGHCAFL